MCSTILTTTPHTPHATREPFHTTRRRSFFPSSTAFSLPPPPLPLHRTPGAGLLHVSAALLLLLWLVVVVVVVSFLLLLLLYRCW